MVLDNPAITEIAAMLEEGDFHHPPHQLLFTSIKEVWKQRGKVDLVLLKDHLGPRILEAGGTNYLAAMIEQAPDVADWRPYAGTVKDRAKARRALAEAGRLVETGDGLTLQEIYDGAERIRREVKTDGAGTLDALLGAAVDDLDAIRSSGFDIRTGYASIDNVLGGVRRGKLLTVGGKTSHGKTTFALNIVLNNLRRDPTLRIVYNAFEDADQLFSRLASMESGLPLEMFLKPHTLAQGDYDALKLRLQEVGRYKDRLRILCGVSANQLRAECETFKPDLIVVDYLQRYAHKFGLAREGRLSHEIGKAVSDFQDIAIEYRCAFLLLSQLKRMAEDSRLRRPQLDDLKESGDIEFLSDGVILLWWKWRDDPGKIANQYTILVEKNKLGPRLETDINIQLPTLRLEDYHAEGAVACARDKEGQREDGPVAAGGGGNLVSAFRPSFRPGPVGDADRVGHAHQGQDQFQRTAGGAR